MEALQSLIPLIIVIVIIALILRKFLNRKSKAINCTGTGIGGWLAFLIFGLMVLWPLVQFGQISNEFRDTLENLPALASNPEWLQYKQISWGIFMISAIISFSAGYRLWKIHFQDSVQFAVIALWLSGPVADLIYPLVALVIFSKLTVEDALSMAVPKLILSILSTVIWVAYLKFSVRVKNTYKH